MVQKVHDLLLYMNPCISIQISKAKTTIRPPKAKAIRQSHLYGPFLRLIRGVITIKTIRQTFQVDSRRHDILQS